MPNGESGGDGTTGTFTPADAATETTDSPSGTTDHSRRADTQADALSPLSDNYQGSHPFAELAGDALEQLAAQADSERDPGSDFPTMSSQSVPPAGTRPGGGMQSSGPYGGSGGSGKSEFSPRSRAGNTESSRAGLQVASLRMPPHSIESEQAVLGALLISPESYDSIADIVSEPDFYQFDHRLLFRAIVSLGSENQPTDVVTVTDWLEQNSFLEDAGGLQYVAALAQEAPGAANVKAYATIVHERAVLRELIAASNEIADSAYVPEGRSSKELLDFAESRVFSIADRSVGQSEGFSNINTVLAGALDRISYLFETQQAITGIGTGFSELDEKTSGLQRSDLVIIAGRPSMGKTSFAMNIAEHAAIAGDEPVAVFSMEMPAEQLAMRMVASLGRIELQKLRSGRLAEQDWPRITSAIALLNQKRNLFIDDTPALTPTEVRARARRLKRENGGLAMIVIDYLQLMRVHGNSDNKANEIAEISGSLKALAKELNVPVIALSQLNRSLEQRPDKRPIMSDLRESGAIEQDADVIMFVYREEVYEPEKEEVKGVAEILIRKQRNGPIGSVKLTFLGANTRFENFSPELAAARQYQDSASAVATPASAGTTPTAPSNTAPASVPVEPANLDDF